MSVSVVVTNWNYGDYLAQALDSVLAQTRKPDRVIVVDDASTDEKSLRLYSERSGDFLFIRHEKQLGATAAYATGLHNASTDWVIHLDADDELSPNYVEATLGTAEEYGVPWVYTDWEAITETGDLMGRSDVPTPPAKQSGLSRMLEAGNFIHAGALISTQVARDAGGWQLADLCDHELWRRVASLGHMAVKCPYTTIKKRQHGASRLTGRGLA